MADDRVATVPEVARILGKTPDAVRGLIRRGTLTATRGNDGRLRVLLSQELATAATGDGDGRETVEAIAPTSRDGRDRLLVEELRERLARAEAEAAELRERVTELRVEVGKGQAQITAAQIAAEAKVAAARDAAEAQIAAAGVEVAAVRELADRLTAELAEARRPWWRRWRG